MPEGLALVDRLVACQPIHIGKLILLTVERVTLQSQIASAHAWVTASKEPVVLVVRDSDGIRTIDVGAGLSVEQLREQIPGLDDLISQ